MSERTGESEFDPSYIAGLLDGIGRVRFDISETEDGDYTVRPMVRIKPHGTEMRAAVVGEFVEERGYRYDYVERDYGLEFFQLQQRADIEDLMEYLEGESAHLVRELEFTLGVFAEEFDFDILEPRDLYRFLLARDRLRHGWRPRGRYHVAPDEIATEHDIDTDSVRVPELPGGRFRSDYSIEWVAGLYDALCRYRPAISQSDEYALGYGMYPVARLHRAGVNERLVDYTLRFCEDYDLSYGDSSKLNDLTISFSGSSNIRRVLDVLFPRLLVLAEHSDVLVNGILPRFDDGEDHDKQGFYELIRDFDPVANASGGPRRHREYDSEYFADVWREELDIVRDEPEPAAGDGVEPTQRRMSERDQVTLSAERFDDSPGRFQSLVDLDVRDADVSTELRALYSDRCQLCGTRLASADGTGYSEVHHLQLADQSEGRSTDPANAIVLCPNHHADFDNGVVRIDVDTLAVEHPFDSEVDGSTITTEGDHELGEEYVRYHNERVSRLK